MQQLRVFGIYRSMLQFFNDSKQVLHPFDTFRGLPDSMLRVICATLHRSPLETMRFRLHKLKQWRQLADKLQADNAEIFKGMDTGCAAVLKGKHLALLERLANMIDWPDRSLHEEIRNGFKLVGMQQPTGVFAADVKPRTLSADELENQLEFIKPALWNKMQSEQQAEYANELWEATMEEVTDKKWLEGPYNFDELEVMFNQHWLPVRRFAVWQRSKWRAIDDFSECGVNSSFAYFERVDLKALDETLWIACCFTKFCLHEDRYDFTLSSGERLAGNVSEAWRQLPEDQVQVVSKTVDLKSAYKQFAILPDNRKLSVLSLKRPSDGRVHGFISRTLPFGSVASVLHFNRVARLLHQLGLELGIVWANYYDDYPVVDFKVLSKQTDAAVRALTSMLGFKCATDKELPFADRSELLGVVLDSGDSAKGVVRVSNKEDRLDELSTTVQSILDKGRVIPRDLPSLFGRALFVESQLLGRAGRLALSELRALEKQNAASVELTDIQMQAFSVLLDRYKHNIPRTIKNLRTELPVIVFTDGACEQVDGDLQCTIGGVLWDPCADGKPLAFGAEVSHEVVLEWKTGGALEDISVAPQQVLGTPYIEAGKQHPVALTELYAVCTARHTWSKIIDGRRCIFFIDNQGVLDALIKGYSGEPLMKRLLCCFERTDFRDACLLWFSRVASPSNISDLPSRGKWQQLKALLDCVVIEAECPINCSVLKTLES
eukprot:Skav207045  [mRNA]  locus=scaffold709:16974:19130:+ [translate_table: standard]